jgi:4'-phosphopantetheinyl transferase
MIRWLIQTTADHPDLAAGRAPAGLLTAEEATRYQAYTSPRRRRDWLLGRWTAKQLVQRHIALSSGFRPALDSFTVAQEPSGAPYVASHYAAVALSLPLALSISHSQGYALCALSADKSGHTRLGADIEFVEPQPEGFAERFFTPAEQHNIKAAPLAMHTLLTTATWSAKEAVLKATHLGLRADPCSVQCLLPPACPRHWTPLRVHLQPATRTQSGVVGALRAWWRVIDNRLLPGTQYVLTLAAFGAEL